MWILIDCKASSSVQHVMEFMTANAIAHDESTAAAVITSYRHRQMPNDAIEYYLSLCSPASTVKPNRTILSAILQSFYSTGDITTGLRLIIEADSLGIILDSEIFTDFFRACIENDQDSVAVKVFLAIRTSKPILQLVDIYNSVKPPDSVEISTNLSTKLKKISSDTATFLIMIQIAQKNSSRSLAVYVAKDMLKNSDLHVSSSKRILVIAIDLCIKDHKYAEALDIIECVKMNGKFSSSDIVDHALTILLCGCRIIRVKIFLASLHIENHSSRE